jgi:ubiquinone/menaquinone biosynthesis C-methylase UbiE
VKRNILQRIWHTGKLRAVIRAVGSTPVHTLVDVGSADGSFVHRLVAHGLSIGSMIAVDPYFPPLRYGKAHFRSVRFLQADAHDLPLRDNSVDVVMICETLEHVVDPYCTIKELKRVIKKDGAIVVEMDSGTVLFQIVWFLWKKFGWGKVWNNAHLTFFTVELLEKLFTNAGLKIERKELFNASMGVCFRLKKT